MTFPTSVPHHLRTLVLAGVAALLVLASAGDAQAQEADPPRSFVEQAYESSPDRVLYRLDLRAPAALVGTDGASTRAASDPLPSGPRGEGPPLKQFGWKKILDQDVVYTIYDVGVNTETPRTDVDLQGQVHVGTGAPIPGTDLSVAGPRRSVLALETESAQVGDASRLRLGNASTAERLEVGVTKTSATASRGFLRQIRGSAWYDHLRVTPQRTLEVQAATSGGAGSFGGVAFFTPVTFADGIELEVIDGVREINPDSILAVNGPMRVQGSPAADFGIALRRTTVNRPLRTVYEESEGQETWSVGLSAGQTSFQVEDSGDTVLDMQKEGNVLITPAGNVGIGVSDPDEKLTVNGTIRTKKVVVTAEDWADFVFEDDYDLPALSEVDAFIDANGHLPGIPTTEEAARSLDLAGMDAKLLRKVEELVLYTIDQNERLAEQERRMAEQRRMIETQKQQIQAQKQQVQAQQEQIQRLVDLVERSASSARDAGAGTH